MVHAKMKGLGPDLTPAPDAQDAEGERASRAVVRRARAHEPPERSRTDQAALPARHPRSVADVRTECVRALKVTKDPVFCQLFAKSLASKNQAVRIAAAEALGRARDGRGRRADRAPALGRRPVPPQQHHRSTTQVAYVKDYDVQVAQRRGDRRPDRRHRAGRHGLDVAVVSVQMERHVYFTALGASRSATSAPTSGSGAALKMPRRTIGMASRAGQPMQDPK